MDWVSSEVSWFFFFSSRRRHTRSKRDWSSDVCSSDLLSAAWRRITAGPRRYAPPGGAEPAGGGDLHFAHLRAARSEERRVGKECRFRWGTEYDRKREKGMRAVGVSCQYE